MQIMYTAIYSAKCTISGQTVDSELVFWHSVDAFLVGTEEAIQGLQWEAKRLVEQGQPELVVQGVGIVFEDDRYAA